MSKKFFVIAGEHSGDYLGSKLIEDLKILTNNRISTYGIGGPLMKKAGMNLLFDMSEINLIGITEVIPYISKILKKINDTVEVIKKIKPDVVITIDSSGFTHRVAKKLKKEKIDIPVIHYVAPPVWAWRSWRANRMHKFIDLLLTLFPFEPKYFEKYGLRSLFVGHPIAKDPALYEPTLDEKKDFIKKYGIDPSKLIICFLPGSRVSEIKRHMLIFNQSLKLMNKNYGNIQIVIPTIEDKEQLIKQLSDNSKNIIVTDKRDKSIAMYISQFAIAASGSVNLELAIAKVPTIMIYKTSKLTAIFVKLLLKIDMVNIVNILMHEKVIPEILQNDCTPENIVAAAEKLISSRASIYQKDIYKDVTSMIKEPEDMLAAKEILNFISDKKRK